MKEKLRVGVMGASGHAGGELCRLLLAHAAVESILPSSRSDMPFERLHPNLLGSALEFVTPEALISAATSLDVVFFCTPSGEAMKDTRVFLDAGCRVVDLSPDFRFPTPQAYEAAYGQPHLAPDLLSSAVYGATELFRPRLPDARLVANPGCYALACLLALAPLVKSGLLDLESDININAVNGTTGASSTPARETHHAAVANGMLAYSLEGHRHSPELEHYLGELAGEDVTVVMNTSHGPFPRGIQAMITAKPAAAYAGRLSRDTLTAHYLDAYGEALKGEPFVVVNSRVKAGKKNDKEYHLYPNVARLAGSNFCHLSLDFDPFRSRIKIVSVIDNLGKGAAGSAIQNMNVMFGLPEHMGLQAFGL